jgi:hypothetical protein
MRYAMIGVLVPQVLAVAIGLRQMNTYTNQSKSMSYVVLYVVGLAIRRSLST